MKFLRINLLLLMITSSFVFAQTGWTYYKYDVLPLKGYAFCIKSDLMAMFIWGKYADIPNLTV